MNSKIMSWIYNDFLLNLVCNAEMHKKCYSAAITYTYLKMN